METNIPTTHTLAQAIAKSRELFAEVLREEEIKDTAIASVFAQNDARRAATAAKRAARKANQVVSPMLAYLYSKP